MEECLSRTLCLEWVGRVELESLLLSLAGGPLWLVAFHGTWELSVTQVQRGLCVQGAAEAMAQSEQGLSSLVWRSEVGFLAQDWARAHLCALL